jgi:hypothetical protein
VKHNKVFHTLALATIFSLLVIAIPAVPCLADTGYEDITVVPSSGAVDDYIEVEGDDFEPGEKVYIYFSSEEADVEDDVDDLDSYEAMKTVYAGDTGELDEGEFSVGFDVPDELTDGSEDEDVQGGEYYVYATYDSEGEIVALDDFSVIGISISPTSGVVGTRVTITGAGFDDREDIEISFGSTDMTDEIEGDTETDRDGDFTSYILVPESTEGDHTITVEVSSDEGEADFTVEPKITISPEDGAVGDSVTVSGTGFGYRKDITITFDNTEVTTSPASIRTDTDGSFADATFSVPEVGPGTYDVEAEDTSGNSSGATFSITTDVSISPTTSASSPGYVGMDVTISGTGFAASHEITITYASEPVVFTTTSEADGTFSYTFDVPPSTAGTHTITASDGTSSMEVTFVMESTPPETPPPLQPYMEGKADSETYFDWEDVTDDIDGATEKSTPITYDLQVATDANFTTKLVNKPGLTTSEYTLTEEEALESTGKDAPYYWRVRAVDAASNAGVWTGAGQFTVGFIFGFPKLEGWVLYVLIGVVAVLLFFVGLWVGRRGGMGGEY